MRVLGKIRLETKIYKIRWEWYKQCIVYTLLKMKSKWFGHVKRSDVDIQVKKVRKVDIDSVIKDM